MYLVMHDLMVRMPIWYFGKWIRILSNNTILVLYRAEDVCRTRDSTRGPSLLIPNDQCGTHVPACVISRPS